jgi:hypothetical protein
VPCLDGQVGTAIADARAALQRGHPTGHLLGNVCLRGELVSGCRLVDTRGDAEHRRNQGNRAK